MKFHKGIWFKSAQEVIFFIEVSVLNLSYGAVTFVRPHCRNSLSFLSRNKTPHPENAIFSTLLRYGSTYSSFFFHVFLLLSSSFSRFSTSGIGRYPCFPIIYLHSPVSVMITCGRCCTDGRRRWRAGREPAQYRRGGRSHAPHDVRRPLHLGHQQCLQQPQHRYPPPPVNLFEARIFNSFSFFVGVIGTVFLQLHKVCTVIYSF